MSNFSVLRLSLAAFVLAALACGVPSRAADEPTKAARPNVVILYADDMGYGDLGIQNPASKIPTPHLDQLAREGKRFSDAHSSSGKCSRRLTSTVFATTRW